MNQVILSGWVQENPAYKSELNKNVVQIKLAVRQNKKSEEGKQKYDYFYITYFDQVAEIIMNNVRAQSYVTVVGRIENNTYVQKSTLEKITRIQIIGHTIEFNGASDKEPTREKKESTVGNEPLEPKELNVEPDDYEDEDMYTSNDDYINQMFEELL